MSSPTPTTSFTKTRITITDQKAISAFNRGPITAVFLPPASCTNTLTLDEGGKLYFGHNSNGFLDLACYPSGSMNNQELTPLSAWETYYHSPAICPYKWTIVKKFTTFTWGNIPTSQIKLGSETRAGLCCPSGYSYRGWGFQCSSSIDQGQMIYYLKPTDYGANTERGNVSSNAQLKATEARGDGVPIWWQSTDQEVLAAASTTTLSLKDSKMTSTQSSPTSSIATPTSTPTSSAPEQPNSSTGLSTGAKAGISVGAFIGMAVLALAVVWFFLRRKRRLLEVEAELVHEADPGYMKQSLCTNQQLAYEMLQPEVHQIAHELPGPTWEHPNRAVELENGTIKS